MTPDEGRTAEGDIEIIAGDHRVLCLHRYAGDWLVKRFRRAIKRGRVHGEWIPEKPLRYVIRRTEDDARRAAYALLREVES